MLGKPVDLIYTPEDRAANVEADERARAVRDGRAEDERWHLRKDGSRVYFSGVLVSLAASGGVGFAKMARDLTATRLAEKERDALLESERSLRAQLQEASVLKDQFLAVMSHELKNPLNLISLASNLLLAQPETGSSPTLKHVAGMIGRSVKSQTQLIDDLLDPSRTRTGKLTLNLEQVDCSMLVERALEAVRLEAQARQIEVELYIEPGDYRLKADPGRIEQIVWNLASNAIKFTPEHGRVRISLASEAAGVRLEVADTGQGIEAKFLPFVFDMFRQGDLQARTRGQGGLGIGLTLVKSLTEAHGGTVSVTSAGVGHGATFTVVLPHPIVSAPAAAMPTAGPSILAGLRLLLVDDDRDALQMFAALLEAAGASVATACSAQEALEMVTHRPFDLIASDIGMPDMDGYALLARLREAGIDVPIIAVTGFARADDRNKALAAGFDEHLGKPLQYGAFVEAVVRLLPPDRTRRA